MASVGNAFDLLIGTGEQLVASKKKKKNKPKPKPADAPAAAPAAASVTASHGDAKAKAQDTVQVVPVAEACALLENSARTYKSGSDRLKLWKDWIKQASDKAGSQIQYKDTDGSVLDFKQVLLRSKALEVTAEGCITSPLPQEQSGNLQALLNTFTPPADTAAVASAISRLASLLADDSHSFDTLSAAQRAVNSSMTALKTASEGPQEEKVSLGDRLRTIERDLERHQAFLNKMAAGGVTKQHVESAHSMVKLQAEKFDLLQPSGAHRSSTKSNPALASGLRALEELKGAIATHLKEAVVADQRKGQPGSKEAKGEATLAALRREEAALQQQASDLASQIRALEAQLSSLRAQAADVEGRRAAVTQRKAAATKAAGGGGGGAKGAAGLLGSSHYQAEMAAAEQLTEALDPSAAGEERALLAGDPGALGELAASYMTYLRQLMSINSSSMADVPGKLTFCKQRIAQAVKMSALGAATSKQKEDAERLMADALRTAHELLQSSGNAMEGMRQRFHVLGQFAPELAASLASRAYELEDMFQHTRGQFEVVMAVSRDQAPTAGVAAPGPSGPAAAVKPLGGIGHPAKLPVAPAAPAPVAPVAPIAAPKGTTANGNVASHASAAAAAAPRAPPAAGRPAAAAPAPAVDGFQQVSGKKNRRKA